MKSAPLTSFYLLITSLLSFTIQAQENPLEPYEWKKRIVLLITATDDENLFLEQQAALGELNSDFDERKLLVLEVRTDKYRILNEPERGQESSLWLDDEFLFMRYRLKKELFSVVLIGLDGGVKLQQAKVVSRRELFDRIDAMPMRSAEMRNKY